MESFTVENFLQSVFYPLSIIVTIAVTKYTATKPQKLAVKEQQFKLVYLPLHRALNNVNEKKISHVDAVKYAYKIKNTIDKHYELTFPQLHKLIDETIKSSGEYKKIFKKIKCQIDTDYELLKKALGYPTKGMFSIFRRMTVKGKVIRVFKIVSWTVFISIAIVTCFMIEINYDTVIPILLVVMISGTCAYWSAKLKY